MFIVAGVWDVSTTQSVHEAAAAEVLSFAYSPAHPIAGRGTCTTYEAAAALRSMRANNPCLGAFG
jgi:hypothetical protein